VTRARTPPRTSLRILLAAIGWLGLAAPLAAAGAAAPPSNEDCVACHDTGAVRANGTSVAVDPKAFEASTHGSAQCVDCHSDLAQLAEFPHPDKLARVNCASCHDDVGSKFRDSIHARARERAGLVVAPLCADCHGKHDIAAKSDPASRVSRAHVPATCETCHAGIRDRFELSIHATALKKGDPRAPTCTDCHSAHSIQRADTDQWRLRVTAECGTCHQTVVDSFRRTFHGKVTQLGFTRVATCADCHGAHDILPASDPRSSVSSAKRVETCARCHKNANASFVKYDPHPNPRNFSRGAVMWWANVFYWLLIPGCFAFFGLHSALWLNRSLRERRRKEQS
jgi:nitrate/TMAO reductase-like tetraheme cytochrome c subunit